MTGSARGCAEGADPLLTAVRVMTHYTVYEILPQGVALRQDDTLLVGCHQFPSLFYPEKTSALLRFILRRLFPLACHPEEPAAVRQAL